MDTLKAVGRKKADQPSYQIEHTSEVSNVPTRIYTTYVRISALAAVSISRTVLTNCTSSIVAPARWETDEIAACNGRLSKTARN